MSCGPDFQIELVVVRNGFDKETCWVHARAGAIPGAGEGGRPSVVMTMQKLLLSGSDVFYCLHEMRTDDLGATWAGPREMPAFRRWGEPGGIEACVCDFTPKWHAASGKLLGVGHVARYLNNRIMPDPRPNQATYAAYDSRTRTWSAPAFLDLPDEKKFFSSGAGCVQRFDKADGEILLPISFHGHSDEGKRENTTAAVARCAFDGSRLTCLALGNELTVPEPRGLGEPSLTQCGGRYFLTLRNDVRGYVTRSDDGLRFEPVRPWTFDDGSELGNYNTQQHWVAHSDGLFLAYTRRGANNDHVFRHRAPLFLGQVDPERLCIIRKSERTLVPERGARLGNFGVCAVSEMETWVVAAEWMQPVGCEKHGSDNTIYAAKVLWDRPNGLYPLC